MQVIVGIISTAGVFIALMMLIRDMKRENTKVLEGIAGIQKDQSQILKEQSQILAKVEANTRA